MSIDRLTAQGGVVASTVLVALFPLLGTACASTGSVYDADSLDSTQLAETADSTLYDFLRKHSRLRHEPSSDAFFFHGARRRALLLIDSGGRALALPTVSEAFGTHGDYMVLGILRRGWIPLDAVERITLERRRPRLESSWADCNCEGVIVVDLKPAAASQRTSQ